MPFLSTAPTVRLICDWVTLTANYTKAAKINLYNQPKCICSYAGINLKDKFLFFHPCIHVRPHKATQDWCESLSKHCFIPTNDNSKYCAKRVCKTLLSLQVLPLGLPLLQRMIMYLVCINYPKHFFQSAEIISYLLWKEAPSPQSAFNQSFIPFPKCLHLPVPWDFRIDNFAFSSAISPAVLETSATALSLKRLRLSDLFLSASTSDHLTLRSILDLVLNKGIIFFSCLVRYNFHSFPKAVLSFCNARDHSKKSTPAFPLSY